MTEILKEKCFQFLFNQFLHLQMIITFHKSRMIIRINSHKSLNQFFLSMILIIFRNHISIRKDQTQSFKTSNIFNSLRLQRFFSVILTDTYLGIKNLEN